MKFSERLKREREKRGLFQWQMAQLIGVRKETVGVWERGRRPTDRSIRRVARALKWEKGVYIRYLKNPTLEESPVATDDELINDSMRITGEELRRLRHKHKLSQYKLAGKMGLSPTTISRWEEGDGVSKKYIAIICRIFDLEYESPTPKRTDEERAMLSKQKAELLERMDRKYPEWSDMPDDDPDLVAYRELVNA